MIGIGLFLTLSLLAAAQQPIPAGFGAGAYRAGEGLTDPVLIREVRPEYPGQARRAGITGAVEVEAVVKVDGTVGDVRIAKSLDAAMGLDAAALTAVTKWQFRPAILDGRPVPFVITVVLEFVLHTSGPEDDNDPEFFKGAVRASDDDVIPPVVVRAVPVRHTPAALAAKIEGVVEVDVAVLPNGTVARARVKKSLDKVHGLDAEALDIAKRYLFKPDSGTYRGAPVPVVVTLSFEFKLR